MNCPVCNHGEHRVLRTNGARRTRECLKCGKRWFTIEAPEDVYTRAEEIREAFQRLRGVVGEE